MIYQSLPETSDVDASCAVDVRVIFKTHLDLGFTDFANTVYHRYMTEFMPRATQLALEMDEMQDSLLGTRDRFIWTTGSWLVTKYLEHARGRARSEFEEAITRGLIRWHALPFTFQTEALNESLLEAALRISQRLDARFGVRTIAAKMTDVPGHTRGLIPIFAEAGVRFLHIGVNPASVPPDVPPLFRWQHRSGTELLVCYDNTYGGFCPMPGQPSVFALAMTGDNAGPPPVQKVLGIYSGLRERFPMATVSASNLEEMAVAAIEASSRLPVVCAEIGDSWIHGYGSDPWKMAAYRALARLRGNWISRGNFDPESAEGIAFDENLLQAMEHTWGLDEKTWVHNGQPLCKEERFYRKSEFTGVRSRADFRRLEESWTEQRQYIRNAVGSLSVGLLRNEAEGAVSECMPLEEEGLGSLPCVDRRAVRFRANETSFALRSDGALWIPDVARAFFGALRYQIFGSMDYDRYQAQYLTEPENTGIWAPMDFGKPGLGAVVQQGRTWRPQIRRVTCSASNDRVVVEAEFPEEAVQNFGAPGRVRSLILRRPDGSMTFDLQWFDKSASRIPEALWFGFRPPVTGAAKWHLHKLGDLVEPGEVVMNGSRHLHIVQSGVSVKDAGCRWHFQSVDAALVAPGKPALLNFHNALPNPSKEGIYFNLFNNVWGTNFPMWYEDDARFRFEVRREFL